MSNEKVVLVLPVNIFSEIRVGSKTHFKDSTTDVLYVTGILYKNDKCTDDKVQLVVSYDS